MKTCQRCNTNNLVDAAFCANCGFSLKRQIIRPINKTPKAKKFNWIPYAVGASVLFVCLAVFVTFVSSIIKSARNQPNAPATSGTPTIYKGNAAYVANTIPTAYTQAASSISFDVESVTLNYKTRNMEIRGKLRNTEATKPQKVWVWAYFFAPNTEHTGSWSGLPIELSNPFVSGDEANVTATGHFHWWDNSFTPKSGYYARVSTSTQSGEAAQVDSAQRNKNAAGAYKVRIDQ